MFALPHKPRSPFHRYCVPFNEKCIYIKEGIPFHLCVQLLAAMVYNCNCFQLDRCTFLFRCEIFWVIGNTFRVVVNFQFALSLSVSVGDDSRVKPVVLKTLIGRFPSCISDPSVSDTNPTHIYSNCSHCR